LAMSILVGYGITGMVSIRLQLRDVPGLIDSGRNNRIVIIRCWIDLSEGHSSDRDLLWLTSLATTCRHH
jgi:hypothetical protein